MNKEEIVKYWIEASEVDCAAMNNLYKSGDYVWTLFLGHLVIEKLIKALIVKNNIEIIPKIHDLNKLIKLTDLNISDEYTDDLDAITTFNIEARYPDYKKEFYKKCTKEFVRTYYEKIIGIRKWLLEQLNK